MIKLMRSGGRGLLITGGVAPEKEWFRYLEGKFSTIVAADGGLDTALDLGLKVDRVVGDMDSLENPEVLARFPSKDVEVHDSKKDETDTELGLDALWDIGCTFTCIYGGGGGRLDHLLALAALFDRDRAPDLWICSNAVVVSIASSFRLETEMEQTISFFPVGEEACTMASRGLRWPLDGLRWRKGDAGVSNVASDSAVTVEMLTGRLICVGPLDILKGIRL
jgi:thiamine pyrophosphokinase